MEEKTPVTQNVIRDSIVAAYARLRAAEEDIQSIRDSCPHELTHLGEASWAPGHMSLAVLCDSCDERVRSASQDEVETFYKSDKTKFVVVPYNQSAN